MPQWFALVHGGILLVGVFILLYYARTEGRLRFDRMLDDRKERAPKIVRVYSYVLVIWIGLTALYTFWLILF